MPSCVPAQDLHEQAASALLTRDFSDPDLSYLMLNEQGNVIAQRWEHPERDVPVGSLVKPFLVAAYGQTHASFPKFRCTGKKTCWLARGHGTLQIREAIAYSCNSYFHQLVANAGPRLVNELQSYGFHGLEMRSADFAHITATPQALAQAYLELTRHPHDSAMLPILQGLALSARKGTGKAAGAMSPNITVLAKTGTAPCTHSKKAPGDGFALVMMPADHPREVVLVRLHGRPGSFAAGIAGRMIAAVEGAGAKP